VELGLELASALHSLNPDHFPIDPLDGLIRNTATLDALKSGIDPRRIADQWQLSMQSFLDQRTLALLYK
jgi:Protein of unknown function (DUF1343)